MEGVFKVMHKMLHKYSQFVTNWQLHLDNGATEFNLTCLVMNVNHIEQEGFAMSSKFFYPN